MSDDQDPSQKTEDPTSKRLADSLQKGQVAKSQEVNNWFMFAAGTLVVAVFVPGIMSDLKNLLSNFLARPDQISMDPKSLWNVVTGAVGEVLTMLLMPVVILMVAALSANMVQHPLVFSTEKMIPKLSKLSPIKGLKQKFSLKTLVEFAKNIAKTTVVASVVGTLIWPQRDTLPQLMTIGIPGVMDQLYNHIVLMLFGVVAVMTVIAIIDFMYQKYEHIKSLKMSRQEIKDEAKDSDGDPKIKARLRAIRMERARQRMMAAVPDATVVVTNPTHYAVALKYEGGEMEAPKVVAKGADEVALRIRELAEECDVPIIENPPLARALFSVAEVDEEIPFEHYKPVAEVISYVLSLKNPKAAHRMASA